MDCCVCGEVVFKSVSAVVQKKKIYYQIITLRQPNCQAMGPGSSALLSSSFNCLYGSPTNPRTLTTEAIVRSNGPPALRLRIYSQGENSSYPTKAKAKKIKWGHLTVFQFFLVSMNLISVFKNTWYILLFSYLENLYPRMEGGGTSALPMGSTLWSFQFICLW